MEIGSYSSNLLFGGIGQDDKENRATTRVHIVQVQDATLSQALQAVRLFRCSVSSLHSVLNRFLIRSFELGGEKKTKGAALQFVSFFLDITYVLTS